MTGAVSFSRMRQALSNAQEMDKQIQQQRAQAQAAQTLQSRPYAIDEQAFGVPRQTVTFGPSAVPFYLNNPTADPEMYLKIKAQMPRQMMDAETGREFIQNNPLSMQGTMERLKPAAAAKTGVQELKQRIEGINNSLAQISVAEGRGGVKLDDYRASLTKERDLLSQQLFELEAFSGDPFARSNHMARQVISGAQGVSIPAGEAAWRGLAASPDRDEILSGQEAASAAQTAKRQLALTDRFRDKAYEDNFFGQAGASYTAGDLQQRSALAWNAYLNDPSAENRAYAENLDRLLVQFSENNRETLADDATASWLTQDVAGYAPQALRQLGASAAGGLLGAALTNGAGWKAGAIAGTGVYSYNTMRGGAFKTLRELGVDEETARKAASDEAVLSSLIEMGDTALLLFTTGANKLLELGGKAGLKGLGAAVKKWAGDSAWKNLAVALGKYGIDIVGEGEEERAQSFISLANQRRATAGEGDSGILGLAGDALQTGWNALTGKDDEARAEGREAARTGRVVAAVGGSTNLIGDAAGPAIDGIRRNGAAAAAPPVQPNAPTIAPQETAAAPVAAEVPWPMTSEQMVENAVRETVRQAGERQNNAQVNQTGAESGDAAPAMGAADYGFSGDIGGWKRDAADFVKGTEIPKYDKNGDTISDSTGSMFASNVPRETKETIERFAYEGEFSYGPLANNQVVEEVHTELERDGFDMVYGQVASDLMNRKASPYTTAKAWVLYVQSANRGLDDKAATLSKLLANYNTDVARALQINSIYSKLTPEGRFSAIQRVVDGLNNEILNSDTPKNGQSAANQEQTASAETKESVTSAVDDAYDTALRLLSNIHEALQQEPRESKKMDFEEWRMKIAKNVAKAIEGAKAPPAMTVSKMIQQDILRFAKDFLPKQARQKGRTAVDTLKQYFEHPDWYQDAWKKAQDIVRENHKNDMDVPEFATATMMFNGAGSDPVMVKAITEIAIQEKIKNRNISYTAFLGDGERLANQLSDELIQQTGATGANAQQIRDACLRYVNELGQENTKTNEGIVNREAAAALKMFGLQVSDLIRLHPGDRTMIVEGIADILTEDYGVAESSAKGVASKIADIFGNAVANRAEKAVKAIVEPSNNPKARKSLSDKFREMANMGVFLDPEASRIVTNKLFGAPVQIDERLQQEYFQAKTPEEISAAEKKIYASIGQQIPATFADKLRAWRYLSMLGNFRTHFRNVAGNAMFAPVRGAKNLVGAGMEAVAQRAGWIDQSQRTKAVLTRADAELKAAAKADYENVKRQIMSGDKWNSASDAIEQNRVIFKNQGLERLRKFNSNAMEWEDSIFSEAAYASSLARYLKAQGYTAADFTGDGMTQEQKANARAYAILEAQKATYRDLNAFSEFVSSIGFKNPENSKNKGTAALKKAANAVVEGVMPFKKTPANIVARGVEYSPVGLLKALTLDIRKLKNGEITAGQYMDHLAAGLTGSALFGLGALLAKNGWLKGGTPEDEEQAELEGRQPYSLEIGDLSVTLDWLAPAALPVFMGVELVEYFMQSGGDGPLMDKVLKALKGLSDPVLEMSMMSGLQDALESTEYADNKLASFVANAALGYLKQYVPTVFGQLERAFGRPYRETTFTQEGGKVLNKDAQYMVGSVANKIPFFDYNQVPYIDAWGRMQDQGGLGERAFNNLLNPSYVSDIRETEVDREIKRLEAATGENFTPARAEKVLTIDGGKIILTADEYVTYATAKGQNDFILRTGVLESDGYDALDDLSKGAAMRYARDYADYLAKKEVGLNPPVAEWMAGLDGADAQTVTETLIGRAVDSQTGNGAQRYTDLAEMLDSGVPVGSVLAVLSEAQMDAYNQHIKTAGIAPDVYLDALGKKTGAVGEVDRKTGKTKQGSKQAEVKGYINGLKLSRKQKRALWLALGYSAKESPW